VSGAFLSPQSNPPPAGLTPGELDAT